MEEIDEAYDEVSDAIALLNIWASFQF